jgi:lysophospholipase L1-like esterase
VRKPISVLVVLLASAVLLELVLQAGALYVSWAHERPPVVRATDAGTRVLCVGDSFTYGAGASSLAHAYPAQLEARLRARGLDVRVANAGKPGQASYDVATTLAEHLRTVAPAFVCVLVGTNDRWAPPRVFTRGSEAPEPGFRLEWRTARLWHILWEGRAPRAHAAEAPAVAARMKRVPAGADPVARARRLLASGDALALAAIDAALAQMPERGDELRNLKLRALWTFGRRAELAAFAAQLAAGFDLATATPAQADTVLRAIQFTGDAERAEELARAVTRRHPELVLPWQILANRAWVENADWRTAEADFEHGLGLLGPDGPAGSRGALLRRLGEVLAEAKPEKAVRCIVEAMFVDAKPRLSQLVLRKQREHIPVQVLDDYLASARLTPEQERQVRNLRESAYAETPQRLSAFAENLRAIADLCRAAGAEPLFVTYPFAQPDIEGVCAEVAEAAGVRLVSTLEPMQRTLEGHAQDDFFVADGHCNDAGYAVIADAVAGVLGALLEP